LVIPVTSVTLAATLRAICRPAWDAASPSRVISPLFIYAVVSSASVAGFLSKASRTSLITDASGLSLETIVLFTTDVTPRTCLAKSAALS